MSSFLIGSKRGADDDANQYDEDEEEDEDVKIAIALSLKEKNDVFHLKNQIEEEFNMVIALSIKDAQEDEIERENYDKVLAHSIADAQEKASLDEELDYAYALSFETAEMAQNKYWLCEFCSYYSPPSYKKCVMCDSEPLVVKVSALQFVPQYCGLPGCKRAPVYFDFCSPAHRKRAEDKRIMPPSEQGVSTVFVGPTGDYAVYLLTKAHPDHATVKSKFLDAWLNTAYGNPHVMRIYKIRNNPQTFHWFEQLSSLGNTQSRFHGTSQHADCTFGSNPGSPPCDRTDCRVCNICRQSFSLQYSGSNGAIRMQLRYGRGLYFSATSSKSHDYNESSEKTLRTGDNKGRLFKWRSMFLCSVTIGKPFTTQLGRLPDNMCPPPGFNSVEGQPGGELNYDEVVVYNDHQAIPSYLIVYSLPVGR